MTTQFKVLSAVKLRNSQVMLAGQYFGVPIEMGQLGTSSNGKIVKVKVVGIGIVDPNLVVPSRQGLLVEIITGSLKELQGALLEFK